MAIDNKYERCAENDPRRCQAINKHGQCPYRSVDGIDMCPMHGARKLPGDLDRKAAIAQYNLGKYQSRMQDFANNSEIKSLREEIGIMRMALESLIVQCDNANKLLMYSDQICKMIGQINGLIVSAQKLEEKNNNLLDRRVVIVIADSIVTLIGDYVKDPDALIELGGKICESITHAASPTYNSRLIQEIDN